MSFIIPVWTSSGRIWLLELGYLSCTVQSPESTSVGTPRIMRTVALLLFLVLGGTGPRSQGAETRDSAAPSPKADLTIVGSGISGLAAALDAGRAGANVTVIDMWSVFGGHAVMSGGLVCLVDTPYQRERNVADSPGPGHS